MSVTNINLLPAEFESFLVQSLANLGQRLGVKGDSIQCGSFIFRDILGEIGETYNPNIHVGVIEKENGIIKTYIANKQTLLPIISPQYVTDYQNTLIFNVNKSFTTSIGNGERTYNSNSYITTLKNNRFIFCGVSGDLDTIDNKDKSEFIYEEFDKDSEDLLSGLRICEFNNETLAITFNRINNQKCNIEIFKIKDNLKSILKKIEFKIKSLYNSNQSSSGIINESKIKAVNVDYWINFLRLNRSGSNYKKYESVDFDLKSGNLNVIIDNIPIPENEVIYLFNYDKNETLDQLKEYFTTEIYNFDNLSFKKQIIYSIFNKIYSSNGRLTPPKNCKLYIPIDFIFNYYCNSNDQWKIYGGIQDIHVRFVKVGTLNRSNFDIYYRDDQLIGFIDSEENQSALYNYSVEYSNDNKFIYNIIVERKYALPYVNSDGYWVINDDITNIRAAGKNAGNPNIIIVYSLINNQINPQEGIDYKILTSFDNEVLNNLSSTWKITSTQVEPIEQINLENPSIVTKSNLYRIGCYIPDLDRIDNENNKDLFSKLEYALIINISSINCFEKIDNRILSIYGEEGTVTTLWKLNSDGTKFEVIKNPKFDKTLGPVALDAVHLTNLNNLIKWHILNYEPKHPDRYTNSWIVFDNAKKETKNLVNDYKSYVYPVIANKSADEYYSGNYRNDFNLTLKFYDMINGAEEQNIQAISHSSNKYLTSSNISSTNTLYNRRLTSTSIFKTFEEYVPNLDMPIFDLSEVLTKDQNLLNRANIISLSENGDLFYSYIGSSFEDPNKNRIHIGSSEININLGTDTMVPMDIQNMFKKQTELDIDFDNVKINGFSYISKDLQVENDIRTGHINWEVRKMGNLSVYSTSFIPTSKLMIQQNPNEVMQNFMQILQFNNYRQLSELNFNSFINEQIKRYFNGAQTVIAHSTKFDAKLWIPSFYNIEYPDLFKRNKMIYLGEMLYLPSLLYRLDLSKYVTNMYKIASIKSNMQIIKYQNIPLMIFTSNRFLEDLNYNFNTANSEISFSVNSNEFYTGNTLEIAYYIDQSDGLHLTINELSGKHNYIENLFKLRLEY